MSIGRDDEQADAEGREDELYARLAALRTRVAELGVTVTRLEAENALLTGELAHVARSLAWQQDERQKAEAAAADYQARLSVSDHDLQFAEATVARQAGLLASLEWSAHGQYGQQCPCCSGWKETDWGYTSAGHETGCRLLAAIEAETGGKP